MFVLLAILLIAFNALADNIVFGYNPKGDYVPVKIGNDRIDYGYNPKGDYVPVKIGY